MALILGIGVGLFVLILLWSISILVCLISSKLKAPLSYLGPGCISLCVLVTAILFALPRKAKLSVPVSVINEEKTVEHEVMLSVEYDYVPFIVLPIYLFFGFITLSLCTGLLANYYLFGNRSQISALNSKQIHFSN